ncbi:helix-turn-helix domain-containing protein [Falsibacillus albus]|uniref:helix-turn-helix domain-containing protein n=1 Tax=Falsibacillus albus TaxID=2478915 RepID=UPI0013144C10|nr:helix-turn-helix domain-containing protein [Falsibacillus albus]
MKPKEEIIGEKIKLFRKKIGLTQKELAAGIISQAQMSNIEKGEVIPLSTTLYEISNRLGVDVNLFYEFAYNDQYQYLSEVKTRIRKAIRKRDYKKVSFIVKEVLDNPSFSNPKEQKFLLWHKGVSDYYLTKNLEDSLITLDKALHLNKKNEIVAIVDIEILNSIGILYNETQQYEKSVKMYNQAFSKFNSLLEPADFKVWVRMCYGTAKSLNKLNEHKKSINYCHDGIAVCIKEESLYLLGELHYETGQNLKSLGQVKEAYNSFNKAVNIFEIENRFSYLEATKKKIRELY